MAESGHRRRKPAPKGDTGGRRPPRRNTIASVSGGTLPGWVREEINRSTPKPRRDPALKQLGQAVAAFSNERYGAALGHLREAKQLAPRSATIRELLGLSAYRSERWDEGLKEIRSFRRFTGETIHMAVELDCLRALGRDRDISKAYETFLELGGGRQAEDEVRVVYGSYLLDQDRPRDAWHIVNPGRVSTAAPQSAVRRWYVAARAAAACGDRDTARRLYRAVRDRDPEMAGLDALAEEIGTG